MNSVQMKMDGAAVKKHRRMQRLLQRALEAFEAHDHRASIRLSRQILREVPEHLGAMECLAKSLWRSERYTAALSTLDELIKLNPYEPGYFYMRGLILQSMGRFAEAIDALQRCTETEHSPVAAPAHTALRELLAWQAIVLAEMLSNDRIFAAEYARNPEAACASKGFKFVENQALRQIAQLEQTAKALVWAPRDR